MTVKIEVNKEELINLLSILYKDAQMGIDEEWIPTNDKEGWEAQQVLINTYCKNNNIDIEKSKKYAIQLETWLLGESLGWEYERDYETDEVILFDDFETAQKEAIRLENEYTSTEVVEYKLIK